MLVVLEVVVVAAAAAAPEPGMAAVAVTTLAAGGEVNTGTGGGGLGLGGGGPGEGGGTAGRHCQYLWGCREGGRLVLGGCLHAETCLQGLCGSHVSCRRPARA